MDKLDRTGKIETCAAENLLHVLQFVMDPQAGYFNID
jgi:hypothetical protein